jgi:hypothetical protein
MSLSSVINDLEAEGISKVTTAAFLTSHGVTKSARADLLRKLFAISGEGDHDEDVQDGVTTAFGKKFGEHSDDEEEEEEEEDEAVGVAIANPLVGASVTEVAATVQACGGNIVFVASYQDLSRGEGLFDQLAPAIERIMNQPNNEEGGGGGLLTKSLIIVVEGATTKEDLVDAKEKFENAAAIMLSNIVQPDPTHREVTLQKIFDRVEYVSSLGPVDEFIADIGPFCEPDVAKANVAKSVFDNVNTQTTSVARLHKSPLDLAAVRKLLPLSRNELNFCMNTVRSATTNEDGNTRLVKDFGALCDASVQRSMERFNTGAGPLLLSQSKVAKRIRSELLEEMYAELETLYEEQIELLHLAAFESFKSNLSKLRLSPNLASDMERVSQDAIQIFTTTSKSLRSKSSAAKSWAKADAQACSLKQELREYITLRLQAARADGKYRPVPRKGVTLGFHWLLPKPFGNDYRLEPWQVHAKDDLIYVPQDKITDVRKEDVLSGDWRKNVVPCPTANEMMYMK